MLKDMGALFKQAKEMQSKMTEIQESLAQQKVEASVGGGMVQVTANGNNEILSVKVEEELINMNDKAILEDLLVGAINEAMRKANELKQTEMAKLTGGMKIPGLF
ncbi:MAG: YbaB/EbfC family nucleoid-associated protein [Nitrospinales bacterium]|jgi:DNA-binding YbaB/EbfC family protein